MKRWRGLATAAIVLCGVVGVQSAICADLNTPSATSPLGISNSVSFSSLKMGRVVLVSGYPAAKAAANAFSPVDGHSRIKCKTAFSIIANSMIQLRPDSNGTEYAICVSVDGTYLACPFLGTADAVDTGAMNLAFSQPLTAGEHQVATYLYVTRDATIEQFYISYSTAN